MHKSFRRYSRDSQELIYWLINDYACKLQEIDVGQTASEYYRYLAKKQLKKLYMKHTGIKLKELNPFNNFYEDMKAKIEDTLSKKISDNSKTEIILSDMDFLIRQEFQKLTLALDGTFSLCLNLMSQEKANKFITWLFDYLLDNEIPMREEIVNLYSQSENDKYIYAMLKHKKCCICGKEITGFHHIDRVGTSGYKHDTGLDKRISPLCPYHHAEIESGGYTLKEFEEKYHTFGYILCNEEQVKELKKIYPHHFKGYKDEQSTKKLTVQGEKMASDYSIKKIRQDFKNKGVFYTPPELTEYMKKLIDIDFKIVYDPTCGRGNLLSCFSDEIIKYGQDIEEEAINYCQENLKNFTGYFGDTLTDDKFKNMKFDLILANPPFSIKYNLDKIDKNNDNRFKELPCLPPQSKADWAFMAHILDKISDSGMAIVLEFPGILYRKQKEGEIRKWFVDNNYIDTIISIPKGKFTDTNISTSMIILKKNKKDKKIKFIDVENEMEYIAEFQEIVNNDYDLSVNKYCIKEIEEEKIDPWELECLCRAGTLNYIKKSIELSKIVASLENWSIKEFIDDIKAILEEEQPKMVLLNIDIAEVRNKQMKYYQQKLFNFGG